MEGEEISIAHSSNLESIHSLSKDYQLSKMSQLTFKSGVDYVKNYKIRSKYQKTAKPSLEKFKREFLVQIDENALKNAKKQKIKKQKPKAVLIWNNINPNILLKNARNTLQNQKNFTHYDKEETLEMLEELKRKIDYLLKKNNEYRNSFSELKKSKNYIEDLLKNTIEFCNNKANYNKFYKETVYVKCLKTEIEKIKKEYSKQEEILSALKKNPKNLKIKELDIEIKMNIEELQRLQLCYSQIKEDNLYSKNIIAHQRASISEKNFCIQEINSLQLEIKELEETKNFLFERRNELNIINSDVYEKAISRIENEYLLLKKDLKLKKNQIFEKNNIIKKLQEDVNSIIIKSQIPSREQLKTEALLNTEQQLKNLIYEKDQIISVQIKTIAEYNTKLESKGNFQAEKKQLIESNIKLTEDLKNLEEKYKITKKIHGVEDKKKIEEKIIDENENEEPQMEVNDIENKKGGEDPSQIQVMTKVKEIVNSVKYIDVQTYGYELNLRLRLKKIEFTMIEKLLFVERLKKKKFISLRDIIEELKKDPFYVEDDEKCLLISRFLIENNEHETIELDYDRVSESVHIRNKFKKLIGSYTLYTEADDQRLMDDVMKIVQDNYENLKECFNLMEESKDKEYIEYKTLRDIFKFLDIYITEQQMEYLIMKLFVYSQDLHCLYYGKLFYIFDEYKSSPSIRSSLKKFKNSLKFDLEGKKSWINRSSMKVSDISATLNEFSDKFQEMSQNHEYDLIKNKNEEIKTNSSSSSSEDDEEDSSQNSEKSSEEKNDE